MKIVVNGYGRFMGYHQFPSEENPYYPLPNDDKMNYERVIGSRVECGFKWFSPENLVLNGSYEVAILFDKWDIERILKEILRESDNRFLVATALAEALAPTEQAET